MSLISFFRLLLNLGLCYIILLVHFIVCMQVRYKCKAHLIKHINILICAKQAINIIFIIIYCPTSVSCKEANCGLRHQIAATAVTVLLELSKTMVYINPNMINSKRLASNSNLATQTYFRLPRRGSTRGELRI